MLFIISLGTKARAGGVFSQREFIVSTISALVHHHSAIWEKARLLTFFAMSGKDISMDLVGRLFSTVFFFIVLTFSYRKAVPSLPLSNYCDAFYWLLSLPLWSIWHLIEGRSPLIKGTSTTGRDGNFFVILVSFVILFHCRCDQFQF